jgi:hypothetical protein
LIVENSGDNILGDWFKVISSVAGSANSFDAASQTAYKTALSTALDHAVPITNMVLLMKPSGDSVSVTCAFVVPAATSDAVGANLNDDGFSASFTALADGVSGVTARQVSAADDVTSASFQSLFGQPPPQPDAVPAAVEAAAEAATTEAAPVEEESDGGTGSLPPQPDVVPVAVEAAAALRMKATASGASATPKSGQDSFVVGVAAGGALCVGSIAAALITKVRGARRPLQAGALTPGDVGTMSML